MQPFAEKFHHGRKHEAVEQEKKSNLYALLLLPILAALVGGLVMFALHFWMDSTQPSAEVPAAPVQKSAIALSEITLFLKQIWG